MTMNPAAGRTRIVMLAIALGAMGMAVTGGSPAVAGDSVAIARGSPAVAGDSPAGAGQVEAVPRRVIAAAPSSAEIVCALGACDRLVGVSPFVTYPPEIRELPKIGGLQDPDLETILTLKPDLVILRGRSVPVERLCQENGIRLYHDQTDTLPTLFATIRELGDVLHRKDEADRLERSMRAKLDAVRQAARNRREETENHRQGTEDRRQTARKRPRPKVLLTLRDADRLGPITTVGNRSYLHALIELAGGSNVFGDLDVAYPQVSLEEIVARQPEVILEAMPGEEIDEAQRGKLLAQWKAVGAIKAVERGEVHFLTEDYVLIPSPRVTRLAEKLQSIFASASASRGE